MNKKTKELREAIRQVLAAEGVENVTFAVTGGMHQKASFQAGARRCSYIFSSTPSDHRAILNTKTGVRRLCREALAG